MSESQNHGQLNLTKANEAVLENNPESAILWLLNGIQSAPDNFALLDKLIEVVLQDNDNELNNYAERTAWLSSFLRKHSERVAPESLEYVLGLIHKVDQLSIDASRSADSIEQTSVIEALENSEQAYLTHIENLFVEHSVNSCPLPDVNSLDSEIDSTDTLITMFSADSDYSDSDRLHTLKSWQNRLYAAKSVYEVMNRVDSLLKAAEENYRDNSKDLHIYLIQNADRLLSQAASNMILLDDSWRNRILERINKLKTINNDHINSIINIKANEIEYSISILPLKSKQNAYTDAMGKIIQIQQDYYRWKAENQQIGAKEKLLDIEKMMSNKISDFNIDRNRKYNEWAIKQIKNAMEEKDSGKNKKSDIVNLLEEVLGVIDTANLTQEVNRMYTEVFEYLFGKLRRAKKSDTFEKPEGKLKALENMFNAKKRSIEEF